jgi:pilus assembly protein Flp/PilA
MARERSMEAAMRTFLSNLRTLGKDTRGVTALEYGLIAGLISVVIVTAVTDLGAKLITTFTAITAAL